jgi:hypothetical protein
MAQIENINPRMLSWAREAAGLTVAEAAKKLGLKDTLNVEDWDPKEIDELPPWIALGRIANRRSAARTRSAKKTT